MHEWATLCCPNANLSSNRRIRENNMEVLPVIVQLVAHKLPQVTRQSIHEFRP